METLVLTAKKRDTLGRKVKNLRAKGELPAVLYGHGKEAEALSLVKKEFEKVFAKAGSSSLVELKIEENQPVNVLIHETQLHPVTDQPLHVDFYQVKMDENIKTDIPLKFSGEAPAVETMDGTLVTPKDTLEVECLPKDLVPEIEVDVSPLSDFEKRITVADLPKLLGIEYQAEPEEVIALVEPPRSEEELAELEKPAAAEEEKEALEKMEAETEAEKAKEGEEREVGEKTTEKTQPSQEKPQ